MNLDSDWRREARTKRTEEVRKVRNRAHPWWCGCPPGPPMEVRVGGETGWDRLGQFSGCQAGVTAEVCVCVGGVGCFTWLQGLYTAGGWGEWVAEWVDGGGVSGLLNNKWWEGGVKGVTL